MICRVCGSLTDDVKAAIAAELAEIQGRPVVDGELPSGSSAAVASHDGQSFLRACTSKLTLVESQPLELEWGGALLAQPAISGRTRIFIGSARRAKIDCLRGPRFEAQIL